MCKNNKYMHICSSFFEIKKSLNFQYMKYFLYSFLLLTLSSCGVSYQSIPYFNDLSREPVISETINNQKTLTIQKGDAFIVQVSSLNNMASAVFSNTNAVRTVSESDVTTPTGSYIVDMDGNLRIPMAGSINIENLTLIEARNKIEEQLKTYLKEPVVNLKLMNFRISVLGDVLKPGAFLVDKENFNLIEAIGAAGDLNITANRNDVLLIREKKGEREYIRLDLQSKKLFDSPYFYLQSGDVLYVQPGKTKYASVDTRFRDIGLILSALSIIILAFSQLNL